MTTITDRFPKGNFRIPVAIVAILFCIVPFVNAADPGNPHADPGTAPVIEALFFYGDGCVHCENIKPYIADLASRHPGLKIRYLEVYNNETNQKLFSSMTGAYGITTAGIPTLFIGNSALVGEIQIRNEAETRLDSLEQAKYQSVPSRSVSSDNGSENCPAIGGDLTVLVVIICALIDSINPCGLAVLVFLLITMTAAGSRRQTLLLGGAYIFATFVFHLLVGIGLFSIFALSGLSKLFSIAGGLIAILFGAINIADLLRNKDTFFLSISESRKGLFGDCARMATLPAAFLLGILAGILGFTCTGGIYISILGLMGQDMTVNAGLQWLVLYNLVYIIPLILVTLIVAYGVPPEKADQMRTRYKRHLRIIISVVLITLGLVILLGWMG